MVALELVRDVVLVRQVEEDDPDPIVETRLVVDKLADRGGFASSAEPGTGWLVSFVALAVNFCARHQHQLGYLDLTLGPLRPALGWPTGQHVAVEDDRHAVSAEAVGQRVDTLLVLFAIVTVADENPAHSLSVGYHFLIFKAKIQRLFSSVCWLWRATSMDR